MEKTQKVNLLLVECGDILYENDEEFKNYNGVYDNQYGYYDTSMCLILREELEYFKDYARKKVSQFKNMYFIITDQGLWNLTEEEIKNFNECSNEFDLSYCDFQNLNLVLFSIMSDNEGNITENFIIPF